MDFKRYNGWANYATWRVNLEVFSDMDWEGTYDHILDDEKEEVIYKIAQDLEVFIDEYIDNAIEGTTNSCVQGWARAFTDQVNYHEIAEHIYEDVIEDFKLNSILDEIED